MWDGLLWQNVTTSLWDGGSNGGSKKSKVRK